MRQSSLLGLVVALGGLALSCSGGGGTVEIDASDDAVTVVDAPQVDAPPPIDARLIDGTTNIACGSGTNVFDLPPGGMATGTASSITPGNVQSTTCQGRGAETAYQFTVDHPVTMVATTVGPGTTLDTVLYVRRSCQDSTTELGCNDDVDSEETASRLSIDLTAGTYFLIVDGRNVGAAGSYQLTVNFYEGVGQPCTTPAMCAPGYTCRAIPPSTQLTCERHACDDGRDDDGDGHTDYPSDPGCTSVLDDSEVDTCPTGPTCPACSNGLDDDGDGVTDYPMDPGCFAASSMSEINCGAEHDAVLEITGGTTTGTTIGATNDFAPACVNNSSGDRAYLLEVTHPLATLVVDTNTSPFDTVLQLFDGLCTTALACDDDSGAGNQSLITRTGVAAGTYAIVVDGFGTASGTYQLHVAGTYAAGAACDPAAPYFTCPAGPCLGAPGDEHCAAAACNDGLDDDGDGQNDFPTDPGCTSIEDNDETDTCPSGPTCPQCSNGLDDDGDGFTDYPADVACASAAATTEQGCPGEHDPVQVVTGPLSTGTMVGATNDFSPSCQPNDSGDRVHLLTLAVAVATLTMDTEGSTLTDPVLMFTTATCAQPPLACDDDSGSGNQSLITRANVAAGGYAIIVDTFGNTTPAPYHLNVHGTIAAGSSCNDPLVAAGVLACAAGTTCQAGLCTP